PGLRSAGKDGKDGEARAHGQQDKAEGPPDSKADHRRCVRWLQFPVGGPAEPGRCVSDRATCAERAPRGADEEVEAEPDEEDEGAHETHDEDFAGGRQACGHAGESNWVGVLIPEGSECLYAEPGASIRKARPASALPGYEACASHGDDDLASGVTFDHVPDGRRGLTQRVRP